MRGLDIIDFLAAFPVRGFTLSEVMRATGINAASCHAVLNALIERGHVVREAEGKAYRLGPVLVAVGDAALRAQPLVEAAREAAETMARELDVPVLLSAAIGDEVVGILSVADSTGRKPRLRPGERRPLVPPLGASFVAWEGDQAIEAWLERTVQHDDPDFVASQRRAIANIRERGYLVALRNPSAPRFADEIDAMAASRSDYREGMAGFVAKLGPMLLPQAIEADATYDVTLIAAPVFGRSGACAYNLCFGDFAQPLSGREVQEYAERLLAACLRIMQAER